LIGIDIEAAVYFDQAYYIEINEARWAAANRILASLSDLKTCVDVGCGPGWFADRLVRRGLVVLGVDGRMELVEEARRRVPNALFSTADVASAEAALALPAADLVFCFGLLYHLENPFAAVRTLFQVTGKYLLVETQIAPGDGANFVLVSEGKNETQGLTYHAIISSRSALVKMLYVAGFKFVHRYTGPVDHADFLDAPDRNHRREIFVASKVPMNVTDMVLEQEPVTPKIDYSRKS
jgi:SAM-dependent methyltransferase